MNHTITIGGLLAVIGLFAGAAFCAGGAIAIFAGGMSDAPEAGNDATKEGCIVGFIGLALLALSAWAIFA